MSKGLIIGIISTVLIGGAAAAWYFFSGSEKHLKLVPADAMVVTLKIRNGMWIWRRKQQHLDLQKSRL